MKRYACLWVVTCLAVVEVAGQELERFAAQPAADLRSRAEAGESDAQFELGYRLLSGYGAPADTVEAATWWLRAAEKGNTEAAGATSEMYLEGIGVPQDVFAAHRWAKIAANGGNGIGWYTLSQIHLLDIGDGPDSSYACACAIVATGTGLSLAEDWRDELSAMLSADDLAEAQRTAAGILGLPAPVTAQSAFGPPSMPSMGRRGPIESEADVRRLNAACALITGDGSAKEKQQGLKELKKLAKQGMATAQTALGILLRDGELVPQDSDEAVKWFRKAALQLEKNAALHLGTMYELGEGVEVDAREAFLNYSLAASMGQVEASARAGAAFLHGVGTAQNFSEACYHFKFAAEHGNVRSQCLLGVCYSAGRGVEQDRVEAYVWLKLAVQGGDEEAPAELAEVTGKMTGDEVARGDARFVRLRDQVELDRE